MKKKNMDKWTQMVISPAAAAAEVKWYMDTQQQYKLWGYLDIGTTP
jgi:hypothetical protein